MKKLIAIILIAIMITGLFTACEKGDENTQGEDTDKNSNSSMLTSDDTASAGSSDNISSNQNSYTDGSSGGQTTSFTNQGSSLPMPSALASLKGIEKYKNKPVDYSVPKNWVSMPNTDKDVDVIFFYPTGYNPRSSEADALSDIDDIGMFGAANISKLGQASVFAQSCNVYIPLYRQLSISALQQYGNDENMTYCASFDVYSALDYYFQNKNNGKPFILAGHSQGSVWLSVVLQDYMKKHPEYLERMVAAYVIGFSVTKDYLRKNPHLKFATGAADTGVIISYNTEGPKNKNQPNMVVQSGAVAINPINWKTDATYAPVSKNLGSLDRSTGQLGAGIADAKLDTERGVVICESVDSSYVTAGFGAQSYHAHDYSLYYGNLMKNVADRIAAYKEKNK